MKVGLQTNAYLELPANVSNLVLRDGAEQFKTNVGNLRRVATSIPDRRTTDEHVRVIDGVYL